MRTAYCLHILILNVYSPHFRAHVEGPGSRIQHVWRLAFVLGLRRYQSLCAALDLQFPIKPDARGKGVVRLNTSNKDPIRPFLRKYRHRSPAKGPE